MPTIEQDRCSQCNEVGPLLACDDVGDNKLNPASGKPRYCNNCMIGKKVKVFWPVDNLWYTGTVQEYDPKSGEHQLQYPDGDTEWVRIGDIMQANSSGNYDGDEPPASGPIEPPPPPRNSESPNMEDQPPEDPRNPKMWGPEQMPMGGGFPPYGYQSGSYPPPPPPYGMGPPPPPHMRGIYRYGGGRYGPGGPAGGGPGRPIYSSPYGPMPVGSIGKDGPPSAVSGSYMHSEADRKQKAGPKPWTKEEDTLLMHLVHTMQWPMKWTIVAQSLPGRTGKQCRERYVNHLNPRLKVTEWTPVEDATIFHLYNTIGSHWAKMAKVIPGRTDNGIKNRFHNIRRQYEREDTHRLRLSSVEDFPEEIRLDRLRKFPEHLSGKATDLWDMKKAVGVLAAQSVLNASSNRSNSRFGPFRDAIDGDICTRCGMFLPSVHCGSEICTKTGWCHSCARVPPNVSGNLLREVLNLRRCSHLEVRKVIESWEEFFKPDPENAWELKKEIKKDSNADSSTKKVGVNQTV